MQSQYADDVYSLLKALQVVYPEYQQIWNTKPSVGRWKDIKVQRQFFDQLASKLHIRQPQDWFRVTCKTVLNEGGHFVRNFYKGSVIKGAYFIVKADETSVENCLS
jgi:hypothetical protein